MRTFKGKPVNIAHEIDGVITTNRLNFGKEMILYSEHKSIIDNKFAACISNNRKPNISSILLFNPVQLNDGDVVRISPDGTVTVLIESQSQNNVIIVNNRCNARCVMCPQQPNEEETSIDEILALIKMLPRSVKHLALTGGEPTLDRQKLMLTISSLKDRLPKTHIDLLTNAILLEDLSYVKAIVNIKHPSISFHVPIYSDVSELHDRIMNTKGFYKSILGLYNLATFNQQIEIRFVINNLTYQRMINTAEFIFKNLPFASHIALMGNEYCGLSRINASELWVDPIDYQDELEETLAFLFQKSMNVSIYNHQLCTLKPTLWKFAKQSISDWKKNYLDVCEQCFVKENCGGFFATSNEFISRGIHPQGLK